jgi:protein gp37
VFCFFLNYNYQKNSMVLMSLEGIGLMNKQRKSTKKRKSTKSRGIEWTDYTWNPVAGCQHGCRWEMPDGSLAECYAETIANRVAQKSYARGFEHHYWNPHKLQEPLKLKEASRIFLDSMSDLMGHWVPKEQILEVLEVCEAASWHTFQLLTKNAPRLLEFDIPANVWVGVSAPPSLMFGKRLTQKQQERMVIRQLEVLKALTVPVRWMSIEPLSFDIAPLLVNSPLEWAVIGAATNGAKTYQPEPQWVENVLNILDARGTAVFFKGNLEWSPWREEFPEIKIPEAVYYLQNAQ